MPLASVSVAPFAVSPVLTGGAALAADMAASEIATTSKLRTMECLSIGGLPVREIRIRLTRGEATYSAAHELFCPGRARAAPHQQEKRPKRPPSHRADLRAHWQG